MNEILKNKSLKSTKQRKIVLELINKLDDKATAKNITNNCSFTVDKSTVYRIIDLFILNDIIIKELNCDNEIYYRIKEEHGHYFTCIKCHKREKLNDCPIEKIEEELEETKGYKIISHTVEITGICNKCK